MSPALARSLTFDLTYLLMRHRAWHNAPILSELSIDFLCSEFQIPRQLGTQLVENSLDLLHSYTPVELDWTAEKYEEEFLEHLFICSTLATDDGALADNRVATQDGGVRVDHNVIFNRRMAFYVLHFFLQKYQDLVLKQSSR